MEYTIDIPEREPGFYGKYGKKEEFRVVCVQQLVSMIQAFQLGFRSQEEQLHGIALPAEGSVPDWLSGTLVRNCPSKYDFANDTSVSHWFDGLAMLHSFKFESGKVTYGCRFLGTQAFNDAKQHGKLCSREFGTDPPLGLFDRIAGVFQQKFTDNANVNVARIADSDSESHLYIAMTETPTVTRFDPNSLQTLGVFNFSDELFGQITTAHPHFDYARNCLINVLIHVSASSYYQIYAMESGSHRRTLIAKIPAKNPGYLHSFSISERYIILAECALRLSPLQLLFSGKPYIENYNFDLSNPSRFYLVEKSTGEVTTLECEPFFVFHHVNAFEKGNDVVVDILAYRDAAIVDALRLKNLRSAECSVPAAALERFVLNPEKKSVSKERLFSDVELPRINYRTRNAHQYSFAYFAGSSAPQNFLDQVIKVDLSNGTSRVWSHECAYPGEPVFVARPGAVEEDDGVVLSLVFDGHAQGSFLLVLDARSMDELARLNLPHVVPFGFHGQFFG